ncbi:MAG: glycosyltransferase family 8 protein [Bacteroidota bacterium]
MNTTTVAFAADEQVAPGLYVAIYSVLHHASPHRAYQIYVLDGGLHADTQRRLCALGAMHPQASVSIVSADTQRLDALKSPRHVGRAAYLLLLLPEVLPACDRILYLDVDILVLADVHDLFQVPLQGTIAGAVQNFSAPTMAESRRFTRLSDVVLRSPTAPYFNSGMMVIDVERWKAADVTTRAIDLLARHFEELTVDDQDALNGVMGDACVVLDPAWNLQLHCAIEPSKTICYDVLQGRPDPHTIFDAPLILHFNHAPKPWHIGYTGPYRQRYLRYLRRSGWHTPAEYRHFLATNWLTYTYKKPVDTARRWKGAVRRSARSVRKRLRTSVA